MTKKFHRAKFLGVVHLMQPFYVKGDPKKNVNYKTPIIRNYMLEPCFYGLRIAGLETPSFLGGWVIM